MQSSAYEAVWRVDKSFTRNQTGKSSSVTKREENTRSHPEHGRKDS